MIYHFQTQFSVVDITAVYGCFIIFNLSKHFFNHQTNYLVEAQNGNKNQNCIILYFFLSGGLGFLKSGEMNTSREIRVGVTQVSLFVI